MVRRLIAENSFDQRLVELGLWKTELFAQLARATVISPTRLCRPETQ